MPVMVSPSGPPPPGTPSAVTASAVTASAATPSAPVDMTPGGRPVVLPEGWTVTVTDRIVTTVDAVRDKTTKPITVAARGLVYGLVVGTAGTIAGLLLLVMVLRVCYELLALVGPIGDRPGRSVWIVDLFVGVVLLTFGLRFLGKSRRATAPEDR